MHDTDYSIAANVSPLQFHGRDFIGSLIEALRETGLPAHQLNIELTEDVLMENTDLAIDVLHTLRQMGIGGSIDDFGPVFRA